LDGSNLPAFSAPSEKALAFIYGSSVFCSPCLVGAHRILRPNMTMNRDQNLEHEGMNEDDVFYAEIRKQVLLLTEDEDEDFLQTRHLNSTSANKQRLKRLTTTVTIAAQPGSYFSCWESENSSSVPKWLGSLWRNDNAGTGVFIPQLVNPRTRQRSGISCLTRWMTKLTVSKILIFKLLKFDNWFAGKKRNGRRTVYNQVERKQSWIFLKRAEDTKILLCSNTLHDYK